MGHELHLVGDIRIAAVNTHFGQDENTHGQFPGGGATVRFVREAGWRTLCVTCLRETIGVQKRLAPTAGEALQAGIEIAEKIASCGPLGIRATLNSAHLAFDASEGEAFSREETVQWFPAVRATIAGSGRAICGRGAVPLPRDRRHKASGNKVASISS
jgi:enoyl-CoA hydratase/carnithine racemase